MIKAALRAAQALLSPQRHLLPARKGTPASTSLHNMARPKRAAAAAAAPPTHPTTRAGPKSRAAGPEAQPQGALRRPKRRRVDKAQVAVSAELAMSEVALRQALQSPAGAQSFNNQTVRRHGHGGRRRQKEAGRAYATAAHAEAPAQLAEEASSEGLPAAAILDAGGAAQELPSKQDAEAPPTGRRRKPRKGKAASQVTRATPATEAGPAKAGARARHKAKGASVASDGQSEVPGVAEGNTKAESKPEKKPRARAGGKKRVGAAEAEVKQEAAAVKLELVALPSSYPPGKLVGAHVSMASGIERAVVNAASIGAKAFALDTRSKRTWNCPPLADTNAAAFRAACNAFGFSARQILPHGSYLINLGSPDPGQLQKSYEAFLDELKRCEALGIELYNVHPGHTNSCGIESSPEECMERIAESINRAHAETSGVTVVLENVAGQGSSVGYTFEQLAYMVDRVEDQGRIGVCLDTCHMFAAGYDLTTPAAYKATMQHFDDVVGWHMLKGMHINDSKCALGSRRDRHENIGQGMIGLGLFECIMNDSRLDGLPLIMETPVQDKGPAVNYKKSLQAGQVVFRQEESEVGTCTDKRDILKLYSLCK